MASGSQLSTMPSPPVHPQDTTEETAAALRASAVIGRKLDALLEQNLFQEQFPAIGQQISNFRTAFSAAKTEFIGDSCRLLPHIQDGQDNENDKTAELQLAIALFRQRARFAEDFIAKKHEEASTLQSTALKLLADGFQSHLGRPSLQPLIGSEVPVLLLSFGGPSIGHSKHPLQTKVESRALQGDDQSKAGGEDVGCEEEEWFEDQQIIATIKQSERALRQRRLRKAPDAATVFGVASIDKASRPGKTSNTRTSVGDIVLAGQGKLLIVTTWLPKAPKAPKLSVHGQTITVAWHHERESPEELVMPTVGFTIKHRRRLNPLKDGAFPRATENEQATEVDCGASDTSVELCSLSDDCDYEVALNVQTTVGVSEWSVFSVARTARLPSVVSEMVDFFDKNKLALSKTDPGTQDKPWELDASSNGCRKQTLFLGLTESSRRCSRDGLFQNEVAIRIADVAAAFKPEIKAAPIDDHDNTVVAVFAGTSGHGKSTEINAFVSFLLGGEVDDPTRIMVVDDRGIPQSGSVTQMVTCFRIRPFSPLFQGKTLLIVDTPGYGDSRGISRDAFVTAAMSEFFNTIKHVNAIIFTCRANEARTTFLGLISTYVFSLFAKDARSCLRTIYTFSDAGIPLARGALTELGWPVENGEISVNNSAFTMELDGGQDDRAVREGWIQSVRGQFQLIQALLRAPAIPTEKSAQVTKNRVLLEQQCELAEKKILRTANDAQQLNAHMGALAEAVGAAPGEKIEVTEVRAVHRPITNGKATTLCLDCHITCHEICKLYNDEDKAKCSSMRNGKCTVCEGECDWDRHKNATFTITAHPYTTWVVPEDLIRHWSSNNNTLEGALITAMDTYLKFQENLRRDILDLATLSEELTKTALLHDPTNLIKYIDTIIQTSRVQGAPATHLVQLATARNTLVLVREVKAKGQWATRDPMILAQVIGSVRKEMDRRMKLSPKERAAEEERPCSLYNDLRDGLPAEIKSKAPPKLEGRGLRSNGALYPENLKAIVKLVQLVLTDGGVVAALAASGHKLEK
ncbi:hypothetical protein RB598_002685 [Gaeumannomyces tritici]